MLPLQDSDQSVEPPAPGEAQPMRNPFSNSFVAISSMSKTTEMLPQESPPQDMPPQDMPPRDMPPQDISTGELPLEKPVISLPPQTLLNRSQRYLTAEVSTEHADVLFLWCCFISGLVDSTIYNAFGTFVSMQTGNTVFLGLGGATPQDTSKPYGWAKSLVSICCFCLGCLTFSHATRLLGKLRRITVIASFLAQTLIIFIAATVVEVGVVQGNLDIITDDIDWWTVVPIALLSFQSAGQIVGSRAVNLSELPTVVLTSMLHDIFTDQKLVAKDNVKRNRRVLAFFAILIGAICGGFIGQGTDRMQIPLWIAGGIKLAVTLAWVFWPEKPTSVV